MAPCPQSVTVFGLFGQHFFNGYFRGRGEMVKLLHAFRNDEGGFGWETVEEYPAG